MRLLLDMVAPLFAGPVQPTARRMPGDTGVGAVACAATRSLTDAHDTLERRSEDALAGHADQSCRPRGWRGVAAGTTG